MNHANPLLGIPKTQSPLKMCQSSASALTHSEGAGRRLTLARMASAGLVQTKGLEHPLHWLGPSRFPKQPPRPWCDTPSSPQASSQHQEWIALLPGLARQGRRMAASHAATIAISGGG